MKEILPLFLKSVPQLVLTICATMCATVFAITLSFKTIGVDISKPLQTSIDAYAKSLTTQSESLHRFDRAVVRLESLIYRQQTEVATLLTRLEKRVVKLEKEGAAP